MPTHVQTHTGYDIDVSSFTLTSFDVGSGSNRSLVAVVGLRDFDNPAPTISSIVFNGSENFTYRIRSTNTWAGSIHEVVEIWTLDNPSNATGNVVVTLSEAVSGGINVIVLEYTGANNGVGSNTGSATGQSNAPSVTFTTGYTTSLIVGGITLGDPTVAQTPGTGVTERADINNTDISNNATWAGEKTPTAGSDTINTTVSSSLYWAAAAIELLAPPSASASMAPPKTINNRNQHLFVR